jgi:hypothetical protein
MVCAPPDDRTADSRSALAANAAARPATRQRLGVRRRDHRQGVRPTIRITQHSSRQPAAPGLAPPAEDQSAARLEPEQRPGPLRVCRRWRRYDHCHERLRRGQRGDHPKRPGDLSVLLCEGCLCPAVKEDLKNTDGQLLPPSGARLQGIWRCSMDAEWLSRGARSIGASSWMGEGRIHDCQAEHIPAGITRQHHANQEDQIDGLAPRS